IITWRDLYGTQQAVELTPAAEVVRRFALPATGRIAWNRNVFAIVSAGSGSGSFTIAGRDGALRKKVSFDLADNLAADVVAAGNQFFVLTWLTGALVQRMDGEGTVLSKTMFYAAPFTLGFDL